MIKNIADNSIGLPSDMESSYRLINYEEYADKILQEANIINVITKEIYKADIAIKGEYILSVGECSDLIGKDTELISLKEKFIMPGFIDCDLHFDDTSLTISEYTRISLPLGTTCLIIEQEDLLEEFNLFGLNTLNEEITLMPQHIYCINAYESKNTFKIPSIIPNIPCNRPNTKKEIINDLRNGEYVLIGEDVITNTLVEKIKVITEEGIDSSRIIITSNIYSRNDIRVKGQLDKILKRIINFGVDPIQAIQMVTVNVATWLGIKDIGSIAPGKYADLVVVDGKLEEMNISKVFLKGNLISDNGSLLIRLPTYEYPKIANISNTFSLEDNISVDQIKIKADCKQVNARCMGIIPGKKSTNAIEVQLKVINKCIVPCIDRDILPVLIVGKDKKICIGKGFVKGFKLKNGAIAESVFNGSHNIIAVGRDYEDITLAINHIMTLKGGIAVVKDGKVIKDISIKDNKFVDNGAYEYGFINKLINITKVVEEELKCGIPLPFMHLSFLTLNSIPKWKITTDGLLDVENYKMISSLIDEETFKL